MSQPSHPGRARLLAAGCSLLLAAACAAPTNAADGAVAVKARKAWQRAGLKMTTGQIVEIAYVDGQWTTWQGVVPLHDAAGEAHVAGPTELLPGAPKGALLGRIGGGAPFLVGAGDRTVHATRAGALELGMNDAPDARQDNRGAVTAHVAAGGRTVEVAVDADAIWVAAGLDVAAGEPIAFGAVSGTWTFWEPVLAPHSAAGALYAAGPAEALPGAPKGGLVARIKGGRPAYIGNRGVFTADADGQLQLRINDADGRDLWDNAGAIRVTVTPID